MKNLKSSFVSAALSAMIIILFSSCHETQTSALDPLEKENEALKLAMIDQNKQLHHTQKELKNLELELEAVLLANGLNQQEQLKNGLEKISAIQAAINQYQLDVAQLEGNASRSQQKQIDLQQQHAALLRSIGHQEEEILLLINELEGSDQKLTSLRNELINLRLEREKLEGALYAAQVFIGNKQELLDEGLAEMKGGFLGIGRKTVMKKDFNTAAFETIDARYLSYITLEGKGVELLSSHPEDSYKIEQQEDVYGLLILDPENFWSRGNHLTVMLQ